MQLKNREISRCQNLLSRASLGAQLVSPETLGELHGGGAMGLLVPLVCESLQSRDLPPYILVSLSLPEHRKY